MIGRKERARVAAEGGVRVPEHVGAGAAVAGGRAATPAAAPGGPADGDPRGTDALDDVPERTVIGRDAAWVRAFNVVLTLALVTVLLFQLIPLEVAFVVAFALALLVNLPGWDAQQELLQRHGGSVVLVVAMIFAAGVLTGVLAGTGMVTAMAEALVSVIPESGGSLLTALTAVTSMPLSLVFTPDAYYFGVVPVLGETATALGGNPAEIARAAILGQMTTGFPLSPLTASTFILLGMSRVDLGDHQRHIFLWAFGTTIVMTVAAYATGALTL
jgi:CitMHS family citrate-Mg2+:H+ or citrate-Ca2+:H+ symporter